MSLTEIALLVLTLLGFATVIALLLRRGGGTRGLEVRDLGDGWLTGDRFTAADLYLGAHLSWGIGFGSIPKRDAFVTFVERVNARPAAKRAAEELLQASPLPGVALRVFNVFGAGQQASLVNRLVASTATAPARR